MSVSSTLPRLFVKNAGDTSASPRSKPETGYRLGRKATQTKFDHAVMFQDRCSGMSWDSIAKNTVSKMVQERKNIYVKAGSSTRYTPTSLQTLESDTGMRPHVRYVYPDHASWF